jgi:dynactin complex subunit
LELGSVPIRLRGELDCAALIVTRMQEKIDELEHIASGDASMSDLKQQLDATNQKLAEQQTMMDEAAAMHADNVAAYDQQLATMHHDLQMAIAERDAAIEQRGAVGSLSPWLTCTALMPLKCLLKNLQARLRLGVLYAAWWAR